MFLAWGHARTLFDQSFFQGVRQRFEAAPSESSTLEKLVLSECKRGGERHGTACLVRLVR